MAKKALPFIQSIELDVYRSCKARSKKRVCLPAPRTQDGNEPADEALLRFMLENTSITDHDPHSPRCFDNAHRFIRNICRTLCPGQWCDRGHCKSYNAHCAYYCGAGTRPAACKQYKEYIRKRTAKAAAKTQGDDR